jgi:hypothetical protein
MPGLTPFPTLKFMNMDDRISEIISEIISPKTYTPPGQLKRENNGLVVLSGYMNGTAPKAPLTIPLSPP